MHRERSVTKSERESLPWELHRVERGTETETRKASEKDREGSDTQRHKFRVAVEQGRAVVPWEK